MPDTIDVRYLISIHALAKRATEDELGNCVWAKDFNPRPRKEGDFLTDVKENGWKDFNPRPRKEGDRFWNKTPKNHYHFNPRPRKEGDV